MIGVLVQIAYDGTAFSGWASQKDERTRTVEDVLKGASLAVDPRATGPRGTSRTDAGVHAEGQLAAFDARIDMPPRGWVLTLNQHLPADVAVRDANHKFCETYLQATSGWSGRVGDIFDDITDHGRRDNPVDEAIAEAFERDARERTDAKAEATH
jgi:hypothetical protein